MGLRKFFAKFKFSPHTRGCSFWSRHSLSCVGVFPAYAGMFRTLTTLMMRMTSFPRIRGDVPVVGGDDDWSWEFSPHTRGCSLGMPKPPCGKPVFPAYAGMFRQRVAHNQTAKGFPRIRGDVPSGFYPGAAPTVFSPHTRGCSQLFERAEVSPVVFPAYAGMFLFQTILRCCRHCFPRIRGDVPYLGMLVQVLVSFSPHTRGCSGDSIQLTAGFIVFPAYAGMFLIENSHRVFDKRFPRIRGDVPGGGFTKVQPSLFSPHTRGCSLAINQQKLMAPVFPAYAGMFRSLPSAQAPWESFPRIRGDVPPFDAVCLSAPMFSPHTRGCSHHSLLPKGFCHVFPAYAGMFLLA